MKKLTILLVVASFASALATPVFARGQGMGRAPGMMGSWGPGSAYCEQGGSYYQEPNQSDRGPFYRGPGARAVPNGRFGREFRGSPDAYERDADRYSNYGHMGGFGMRSWR